MQKMKKDRRMCTSTLKFIGIGIAAALFILTFSFSYAWGESEKLVEQRRNSDVFATIDLEDFEGQPFSRDNLADTKLVAYNIWETTCPACLGEMGDLEKLSKEYDPSEFRLVGMCADMYDKDGELKPSQLEKGKQLMKDAGVTFTNLVPDQGFMDYFRSAVVGFPTTFFVDKEGKVVNTTCGSKDYEEWKQYVDSQLQ